MVLKLGKVTDKARRIARLAALCPIVGHETSQIVLDHTKYGVLGRKYLQQLAEAEF